jgi:hypothetical protein
MTLNCFPQGAVNTTVRWRNFQTFASMPRTGEENLKQCRRAPHHDKTLVESLTDSAPCAEFSPSIWNSRYHEKMWIQIITKYLD